MINNPLRYTDPSGHVCYDPTLDAATEGDCNGTGRTVTEREKLQKTRKEFTEQEILYIVMSILAESSYGSYPAEVLELIVWVMLNRVSPGSVFSNLDSLDSESCPAGVNSCGVWAGIIEGYLAEGVTYSTATNEAKQVALQEAINCYSGSQSCNTDNTKKDAFSHVSDIVNTVYASYRNGDEDPTHGSVEMSVQGVKRRMPDGGTYIFPDGQTLHNWLSNNFASYTQNNPNFQYVISEPFLYPYPNGSEWKVFVAGSAGFSCINYGSCGYDSH